MTIAALAIIHLVSGYIFSTSFKYSQYAAVHESDQRIYLRSTFYGIFIAIISIELLAIIAPYSDNLKQISEFITSLDTKSDLNPTLVIISVSSIFWAYPLAQACNLTLDITFRFILRKSKTWLWDSFASQGDFERVIYEAKRNRIPVLITLENSKTYIGFVSKFRDYSNSKSDDAIVISPLLSGYRDSKKSLKFTTNYSKRSQETLHKLAHVTNRYELFKNKYKWTRNFKKALLCHVKARIKIKKVEKKAKGDIDKYLLALPLGKVVSISTFDVIEYSKFDNKEAE